MEINKKFQKVQRALMAVLLLILMPLFLHYYPDLLFFWNATCIFIICYIAFILIVRTHAEKGQYFWKITFLLFSLAISNDFYSYKKIKSIFPMIKKTPPVIMMVIVLGGIILTVFIGLFYKYYITNPSGNIQFPEMPKSIDEQKRNNDTKTNNDNDNDNNVNKDSMNSLNKEVGKFNKAISFIATIFILVVVIGGIIYVFSENEFILRNIHNHKFLQSVSQSILLMGIGIFVICSIIVMILYFFRICYKIIHEMFTNNDKSFWQDDLFLKCVSIFITIGIYLYAEETTAAEVIEVTDNTVLRLLLYTLILAILAMVSLIIFKLLQSMIDKQGLLRQCAENTSQIIIELINNMMESILNLVKKLPDFLEALTSTLKKVFDELKTTLMENDDNEDIL